jgi:hypothetical protein
MIRNNNLSHQALEQGFYGQQLSTEQAGTRPCAVTSRTISLAATSIGWRETSAKKPRILDMRGFRRGGAGAKEGAGSAPWFALFSESCHVKLTDCPLYKTML